MEELRPDPIKKLYKLFQYNEWGLCALQKTFDLDFTHVDMRWKKVNADM